MVLGLLLLLRPRPPPPPLLTSAGSDIAGAGEEGVVVVTGETGDAVEVWGVAAPAVEGGDGRAW